MNESYYQSLTKQYDNTPVKDMPEPCQGISLSAEEYDYKTYWVEKYNQMDDTQKKEFGKNFMTEDTFIRARKAGIYKR